MPEIDEDGVEIAGDGYDWGRDARELVPELRAEIERLRAALTAAEARERALLASNDEDRQTLRRANSIQDGWRRELRAEIERLQAALREIETQDTVEISLDPDWPHLTALHRSFPEAGDGRPLPPMGDELMTAGLCPDDARFVAVQLAQNGYQLVQAAEIERLRAEVKRARVAALREALLLAEGAIAGGQDAYDTYRMIRDLIDKEKTDGD